MRLWRRDLLIGLALAGAGIGVACRRDDGADPPDRGKILADLTTNVIVPTYTDAATDARTLETAAAALRDAKSVDALVAARAAWRKARATWKHSDAFLFGPADDLAITGGAIDTMGDAAKIEALVAGNVALDAAGIGRLGANQRGFAGVEILLFDPTKDDAAILQLYAAKPRRGEALVGMAADLRTKIEAVRDAWTNGFADELAKAGRGSTTYASEHQGVDAVVNALVSAAEVLIAVRLAKPLGLDQGGIVGHPTLVESPRSDASVDDIVAVLDGIEAVYLGKNGGLPLAAAVADRNAGADTRLRDAITKAKEAARAIPLPLRLAVDMQRDPVVAAHTAVRAVKRELATEVAGALGTSLGFTVTDGD